MKHLIEEALEVFKPVLQRRIYKKGAIIQGEEESSNMIFLVRNGILRSYYFVDGKDVTAHFAMEYGIIGAVDSILKGQRSLYSIQALEESEVYQLRSDDMEAILDGNPHLERLARQISQWLYLDLVERVERMTFLTAKERYDHLLSRYPEITQRVSLGHIASFLGITQETLSRVRSQI